MPVRGLEDYLRENGLVWKEPISSLASARLGIDAIHWLRNMKQPKEVFQVATGGRPLALRITTENEVKQFKNMNILPLWVFPGLSPLRSQFIPADTRADLRNAAWKDYMNEQTTSARKKFEASLFDKSLALSFSSLVLHDLITMGEEIFRAPMNTWSQLAYFLSPSPKQHPGQLPLISAIYGATENLLSGATHLILNFNWLDSIFEWVDLETILMQMNLSFTQFQEACVLSGYDGCTPIIIGSNNSTFQDYINFVQQAYHQQLTPLASPHDIPDYYISLLGGSNRLSLFKRNKLFITHQLIFSQNGECAPENRATLSPDFKLDQIIGLPLPCEVYWLLSQGCIGPQVLNNLLLGHMLEAAPLLSSPAYLLYLDDLIEHRQRMIALLSSCIPNVLRTKPIAMLRWYSPTPTDLQHQNMRNYVNQQRDKITMEEINQFRLVLIQRHAAASRLENGSEQEGMVAKVNCHGRDDDPSSSNHCNLSLATTTMGNENESAPSQYNSPHSTNLETVNMLNIKIENMGNQDERQNVNYLDQVDVINNNHYSDSNKSSIKLNSIHYPHDHTNHHQCPQVNTFVNSDNANGRAPVIIMNNHLQNMDKMHFHQQLSPSLPLTVFPNANPNPYSSSTQKTSINNSSLHVSYKQHSNVSYHEPIVIDSPNHHVHLDNGTTAPLSIHQYYSTFPSPPTPNQHPIRHFTVPLSEMVGADKFHHLTSGVAVINHISSTPSQSFLEPVNPAALESCDDTCSNPTNGNVRRTSRNESMVAGRSYHLAAESSSTNSSLSSIVNTISPLPMAVPQYHHHQYIPQSSTMVINSPINNTNPNYHLPSTEKANNLPSTSNQAISVNINAHGTLQSMTTTNTATTSAKTVLPINSSAHQLTHHPSSSQPSSTPHSSSLSPNQIICPPTLSPSPMPNANNIDRSPATTTYPDLPSTNLSKMMHPYSKQNNGTSPTTASSQPNAPATTPLPQLLSPAMTSDLHFSNVTPTTNSIPSQLPTLPTMETAANYISNGPTTLNPLFQLTTRTQAMTYGHKEQVNHYEHIMTFVIQLIQYRGEKALPGKSKFPATTSSSKLSLSSLSLPSPNYSLDSPVYTTHSNQKLTIPPDVTTYEELFATTMARALELCGYIKLRFTTSTVWGNALVFFEPLYEEQGFIALELLRASKLDGSDLMIESKKPNDQDQVGALNSSYQQEESNTNGSHYLKDTTQFSANHEIGPDSPSLRLCTRVFSLLDMNFLSQSWRGPIDQDLLAFNSLVRASYKTFRNLFEMVLLNFTVNHRFYVSPMDYRRLIPNIPWLQEANTALGMVLKSLITEGHEGLPRRFVCCSSIKQDLKRGFIFWNQLYMAVESLYGVKEITQVVKNEFDLANELLLSIKDRVDAITQPT